MLTKTGMFSSAVVLGAAGIALLFAPAEIARSLGFSGLYTQPVLSLLAATYLGFAMANWAAKDSAIGGIYQRPLGLANLAHFVVGALSLIKVAGKTPLLLGAAVVYALFAVFFVWLVFVASPAQAEATTAR